jgi:glucan phosphoethanolaminetransferase (alkaline phosphatase superfamily)
MKFPKQLSTIFLILFLLAFGIGTFILGNLLIPAAAVCAIVAAIFYLLGK